MPPPLDAARLIEAGNRAFTAQRLVEAERLYRLATQRFPRIPEAHNNLGTVLKEQGRIKQARAAFERALALRPSYATAHSNLLFTLQYDPTQTPVTLRNAHAAWALRHSGPTFPTAERRSPSIGDSIGPDLDAHGDPRPTIGLVSPDLRNHPVGVFLQAWLLHRNRAHFRVVAYNDHESRDALSQTLRELVDLWRDTARFSDANLAELIRKDGIALLIDLAGHTAGNRLRMFARRAAPVQASWLGYSATTGLPAIDAVLLDHWSAPVGCEAHFVERVIRLDALRFCYTPPASAPRVAPLPAASRGYLTFGSFNNLAKLSSEVVATWAEILAAVPDSRLILKWRSLADPETRERVCNAFASQGVAPARIEFRGWSRHTELLGEYADVDIALDPFPFSGGLTSCDALFMGVPLVTWPGALPISRQTGGFMAALGLGDWIAADRDAYVALAREKAKDKVELARLRQRLRETMLASPLCNASAHAAAVDRALQGLIPRIGSSV
jgi:protein O-GlcNAc transferase